MRHVLLAVMVMLAITFTFEPMQPRFSTGDFRASFSFMQPWVQPSFIQPGMQIMMQPAAMPLRQADFRAQVRWRWLDP